MHMRMYNIIAGLDKGIACLHGPYKNSGQRKARVGESVGGEGEGRSESTVLVPELAGGSAGST